MPADRAIHYLPAAEKDLLEIHDFISRDSPARAASFVDKLDQGIVRLAAHPNLGHEPKLLFLRKQGYRILVIESYLAFYKINPSTIIIYRVLHGSRMLSKIL